jgi:hypothetical protein
MFVAGQDLILAGDKALAYELYKRMDTALLSCVHLSEIERAGIKIFLKSKGRENPFENLFVD